MWPQSKPSGNLTTAEGFSRSNDSPFLCVIGRTLKVGTRGRVHIYPYQEENPTGPLRTDPQTRSNGRAAISTDSVVSEYIHAASRLCHDRLLYFLTLFMHDYVPSWHFYFFIGIWSQRSLLACDCPYVWHRARNVMWLHAFCTTRCVQDSSTFVDWFQISWRNLVSWYCS